MPFSETPTHLIFDGKIFFVKEDPQDTSLYFRNKGGAAQPVSLESMQGFYNDSSSAKFYDPCVLGKAIETKKSIKLITAILDCMDPEMLLAIDNNGKTVLHRQHGCESIYLEALMKHRLFIAAKYALLHKPDESNETPLDQLRSRRKALSEEIKLTELELKDSKLLERILNQPDPDDVLEIAEKENLSDSAKIKALNNTLTEKQRTKTTIERFCSIEQDMVANAATQSIGRTKELHKLLAQLQNKVNYLKNHRCQDAADAIKRLVLAIRSCDYNYDTPLYQLKDNLRDEEGFKEQCLQKLNHFVLHNPEVKKQLARHHGIVALFERIFSLLFGQPKNSSSFFKTQTTTLVEKLESKFRSTDFSSDNLSNLVVTT